MAERRERLYSDFTDDEYARYTTLALPIIRDGMPLLGKFERLIGMPQFSAMRFVTMLRVDGLVTGTLLPLDLKLTPLGHQAVQHIITVKDGIALMRVKIKMPGGSR